MYLQLPTFWYTVPTQRNKLTFFVVYNYAFGIVIYHRFVFQWLTKVPWDDTVPSAGIYCFANQATVSELQLVAQGHTLEHWLKELTVNVQQHLRQHNWLQQLICLHPQKYQCFPISPPCTVQAHRCLSLYIFSLFDTTLILGCKRDINAQLWISNLLF